MERDAIVITIAANFTADPVVSTIRHFLDLLAIRQRIEVVGYNQIMGELIDSSGNFAQNRNGINVALLRLADFGWRNNQRLAPPNPEILRIRAREFTGHVSSYAQHPNSPPLLTIICPEPRSLLANPIYAALVSEIESSLALHLKSVGVQVCTSSEIVSAYSLDEWDDPVADELGHVPYTDEAFAAIGAVISRKIRAFVAVPFKVLVLDADNSLWTGVAAEDGPDGIVLDEGRLALQRFVVAQHEAGMLLCLCSKNMAEDIEAVFSLRKMPLERHHFVASMVNWRPKSDNVRALAAELSLSLDSFIFMDDSVVECAEVGAYCPDVLTINLPQDGKAAAELLQKVWAFDRWAITAEDRRRIEVYRENVERQSVRRDRLTMRDFISSLNLEITIGSISPADLSRLSQLTFRTNQFNLTTLRRSEAEITSSGLECLKINVRDRFGDYGLVGGIFFSAMGNDLEVDTLMLSCRALGRGVEHAMIVRLGTIAKERQLSWVTVALTYSAKNLPAQKFLREVGSRWLSPRAGGFVVRFPADEAARVVYDADVQPGSTVGFQEKENIDCSTVVGGANAATPRPSSCESSTGGMIPECSSPSVARNSVIQLLATELGTAAAILGRIDQTAKKRGPLTSARNAVRARSDVEGVLVAICEKVLGIAPVGVNDDLFLDLGADSFSAVRIAALIRENLGYPAQIVTVLEARTVERLAAAMSTVIPEAGGEYKDPRLSTSGQSRSIYPLRPRGNKLPLFLVRPAAPDGGALAYVALVRHLDPERPIYVFQNRPLLETAEPYRSVQEMALEYVQAMRTIQPCGPYMLGGWCLGGKTAFEMANHLWAGGDRVDLLILFDSFPPLDSQRQAEFVAQRKIARQQLRTCARYPWASRIITKEKSMLRRFAMLAYYDYENNDVDLIARIFPNCFDVACLRRMTPDAMWEEVYQTVKALEREPALILGNAANLRHAYKYFAIDHQLDALYMPAQQYPDEVTMFSVRGNNTTEGWRRFVTRPLQIYEFDIKAAKGKPSPHDAMMAEENAGLLGAELNRLFDEKSR